MKHVNKKMAGILLMILVMTMAVVLSACTGNKPAAENVTPNSGSEAPQTEISAQAKESAGLFGSFGGSVKEIFPFYESDDKTERPGWYFVSVLSSDGQEGTIAITDKTFFATDAKLDVGASIICFYDANAPVPAINPPQYNAEVVVIDLPDSQTVKVDRFDDNLVSSDDMLKLNIADATEIILQDGEPFDGSLAGRKLAVYYGISTRSIPAQTTPDKIVVLFETAESPIYDGETDDPAEKLEGMGIVVDGRVIAAAPAYVADNIVMLPLKETAEALGYGFSWDEAGQDIKVGENVSLRLDVDSYVLDGTAPIELGAAPQRIEDVVYVPVDFFHRLLQTNEVYIKGSQIFIDSGK